MLYVFYLFEIFKEKNNLHNLENLATGLAHIYEMYFKRLETECKTNLGIDDNAFLTLLNAMVVSREPFPIDFVFSIFGIKKDTSTAIRNEMNALYCISLLFVIKDSRVNFFHKSVVDWLVSKKDHCYKINEEIGNAVLAKLCSECFDNILKSKAFDHSKQTVAEMYAFENGFYYMIKDDANVISHVNSYLENFELVCRCVISVHEVRKWKNDLSKVINNSRHKGKLEELDITADELRFAYSMTRFDPDLGEFNFLQCIMMQAPEKISSKALELHVRFFPRQPYFEKVCEHDENINKETINLFSRTNEYSSAEESSELSSERNDFSSADVRHLLDYVVLCFRSGMVVLISINPFKVIWKKAFAKNEVSCSCIAFHPHHDVILPGRLDQVLSLTDGSWQPGPFLSRQYYFFTECCFSPDNKTMITASHHNEYLTLWDLVSGENNRRIEVSGHLSSCTFSPNGNYLAVLKTDQMSGIEMKNIFLVFDVTNNYTLLHSVDASSLEISLTGYKLYDWCIQHFYNCEQIVFYEFFEGLFFPPSTKAHEFASPSTASQIMPGRLPYFLNFPTCGIKKN